MFQDPPGTLKSGHTGSQTGALSFEGQFRVEALGIWGVRAFGFSRSRFQGFRVYASWRLNGDEFIGFKALLQAIRSLGLAFGYGV